MSFIFNVIYTVLYNQALFLYKLYPGANALDMNNEIVVYMVDLLTVCLFLLQFMVISSLIDHLAKWYVSRAIAYKEYINRTQKRFVYDSMVSEPNYQTKAVENIQEKTFKVS